MTRYIRKSISLFFGVVLAVNLAPAIGAESSSLEDRKQAIMDIEDRASADALERKERSDARLESEGVPVNDWLPAIEGEAEARRRSVEEIAWRAMALLTVALKGEGLEQAVIEDIVRKYSLAAHFSPAETAFIEDPDPSQHDRVQFTWRYEAAWVMLWALGYVDDLGMPTDICDPGKAVVVMRDRNPEQFIVDSKLRPLSEILDETDLMYRYHWAVVDARLNGRSPPADLEPGVTMERHYALNWLIGYLDQEWDDVTTDT